MYAVLPGKRGHMRYIRNYNRCEDITLCPSKTQSGDLESSAYTLVNEYRWDGEGYSSTSDQAQHSSASASK